MSEYDHWQLSTLTIAQIDAAKDRTSYEYYPAAHNGLKGATVSPPLKSPVDVA